MLKAYKYRLYPNREQRVLIEKHFGCTRFVYNWALGLQSDYYKANGQSLSRGAIQSQLVAMKKTADYEWLKEVNSQSLLNALLNVHTAFTNFLKPVLNSHALNPKKYPSEATSALSIARLTLSKALSICPS